MNFALPHGFRRWNHLDEVAAEAYRIGQEWLGQQAFQQQLLGNGRERRVAGYCVCCGETRQFDIRGTPGEEPNWRETLECESCQLINRWRASAHLFLLLESLIPAGAVYMTEQTTPLYRWMRERRADLIGSEFLGSECTPGEIRLWNQQKLRHEDVTRLSMADASLGAVLTFDVMEHVPGYEAALTEFARVLKPGGLLLFTAPFHFQGAETIVRAQLKPDGSIEHLLPPVYHGDPLSENGVLCFQEFGWDLLPRLREAGFRHVELISVWAPQFGYLGSFQPFVVGWR